MTSERANKRAVFRTTVVRMPLGRDLIQVWAVAAVRAVAWGHRGNAKRGGQRERVTEDAPPDEPRGPGLSGARGRRGGGRWSNV